MSSNQKEAKMDEMAKRITRLENSIRGMIIMILVMASLDLFLFWRVI